MDAEQQLARLTAREREVAKMLAIGKIHREIADELKISIKTIDTHRQHLLRKLNLRGNVDLARWAIRVGMVTNEADHPCERTAQ